MQGSNKIIKKLDFPDVAMGDKSLVLVVLVSRNGVYSTYSYSNQKIFNKTILQVCDENKVTSYVVHFKFGMLSFIKLEPKFRWKLETTLT